MFDFLILPGYAMWLIAYFLSGYLLAEGAYRAMRKVGKQYRGGAYIFTLFCWPYVVGHTIVKFRRSMKR